jgi:hypothetical protein
MGFHQISEAYFCRRYTLGLVIKEPLNRRLVYTSLISFTHHPSFSRTTMITRQDDEETPLLQRPEQRTAQPSPLPWDQFWIVLFLQFSDSLVPQTLAPFTPQVSVFPLLGLESDQPAFCQADQRHRHHQRRRISGWTLCWHPGEHIAILRCPAILPDIVPSNHRIIWLKH